MLGRIAAFEFRYQTRSPLFAASAGLIFLAFFFDMAVMKLGTVGGGNVLFNSPHAIIVSHLLASLVFLFIGAAFVSNVIVRDDQTGFGPILRSTRVTKGDYLHGRFLGAFAAGALVLAAVPLGAWLGTLMPFADQQMLGPNRLSGFAYGYGLFALPNALIVSAILFALATATRSTAGTFVGVVLVIVLYLFSQRLMEGRQPLDVRVLADPLGMSAYMAAARYLTAAELNAGAVPVTRLMLLSRLLWVGAALGLLALTCRRFRFAERGMSRRKLERQQALAARSAAIVPPVLPTLPQPIFGGRTALRQFAARASMEARYVLRSPVFAILLLIALAFTLPGLLSVSGFMDVPLHPLTFVGIPVLQASFDTLLIAVAAFYGGELVWRERERRIDEIIDTAPLPEWALMLPKMLGLAMVLLAVLLVGTAVGLLVQWLDGSVALAPGEYLLWYVLPSGVDTVLIAVLAVFVQALGPGKYAGWGIMFLYVVLRIFGPSLGLEHPLLIYGATPPVALSDMAGLSNAWKAAWWFRLFWAAAAMLLLVAVQLLWARGTETRLRPRLRRLPARLRGGTGPVAAGAAALLALSGGWIVYNTAVLNHFRSSSEEQAYLAAYEKRFLPYAALPQPSVREMQLKVDLYPADLRAEVNGRYRLVNETVKVIDEVHVRLLDRTLNLVSLELSGAELVRDEPAFGYRIYRLARPIQPGEARTLAFRTVREQVGFRASAAETALAPGGTDLNAFELTPRIGMSDAGLIEDPAVRRRYGLPVQRPLPRLDDLAATRVAPGGDGGWTRTDITVSTPAVQIPVAPGAKVAERVANGRRTVRFVSAAPIKNFFSIQSAPYWVARRNGAGVAQEVYFHPGHDWNVARILRAMGAATDYYSRAFGPYQFSTLRIAETPAWRRDGGQAFPGGIAMGETGAFAMDMRGAEGFDMVSMLVAHEVAHQWWGHQVVGARMQGAGMLSETLAQYSALMVMKRMYGEESIRPFLQFQLDRYLAGRRTQVLAEAPLVAVEPSQQHIAYGKGALVMYLLQQRMGEAAVNRALARFLARYRFAGPPNPRSLDLVAFLRAEARSPRDQALITDLFERITLYDLAVQAPTAKRRADGRWDVAVPVTGRKLYADGRGREREAPLEEPVAIGLFTADPRTERLDRTSIVAAEVRPIRSGPQVVHFVTNRRPSYAAVDPDGLYIDRNSADNFAAVSR